MERELRIKESSNQYYNGAVSRVITRRERFIHTLPPSIARDLLQYLKLSHRARERRRSSRSAHYIHPYWIPLSLWLGQMFRSRTKGRTPIDRRFINDVLWAQFCMMQQITIHDDLFDRHQSNLALIFAANQFQVEAERVMSKHFARESQFWSIYRTSLDMTNRAILEVRSLQRSKNPEPEDILAQHAKVGALLKVGSAAICAKMHWMRQFPQVSRFADEMAKIGQAVDDFADIEEDLERGEINYASACILRSQRKRLPAGKDALRLIRHALLVDGAISLYLQELRGHLEKARHALQPLKIDAAKDYLARYETHFTAMERRLHRWRMRLIFGDLARSSQ